MKNAQDTKQDTVLDLLFEAPDNLVAILQAAHKAVCMGRWREAGQHLDWCAEAGYSLFHDRCAALADQFYKE